MDLKWNWRGQVGLKEIGAFKKAQKARHFRVRRDLLWERKNIYGIAVELCLLEGWAERTTEERATECGLVSRAFHQPGTSRKTGRVRVLLCKSQKGSLSSIF